MNSETADRAKENALFYNIDSTAWPITSIPGVYPTDGTTNPNSYVAKVTGNGHKMGPAILLKVMSGDSIVFWVKSFYKSGGSVGPANSSVQDILNYLAGGLMSVTGGGHGGVFFKFLQVCQGDQLIPVNLISRLREYCVRFFHVSRFSKANIWRRGREKSECNQRL